MWSTCNILLLLKCICVTGLLRICATSDRPIKALTDPDVTGREGGNNDSVNKNNRPSVELAIWRPKGFDSDAAYLARNERNEHLQTTTGNYSVQLTQDEQTQSAGNLPTRRLLPDACTNNAGCQAFMYCSAGICSMCGQSCEVCTQDTRICTQCLPDHRVNENQIDCTPACTTSQYWAGSLCTNCDTRCTTCTSATVCTACQPGRTLSSGQCILTCITPGQIYNWMNDSCHDCVANCLTCNSTSSCGTCKSGFTMTMYGFQCIQCSTGQYFDIYLGCRNCDSNCTACSGGTATDCTACAANAVLYSGGCMTCSTGQYFSAGMCVGCNPTCTACTGPSASQCSACASGYNYSATQGCITCGGSTYFEVGSGACQNCALNCNQCTTFAVCTTCAPNYLRTTAGACLQCAAKFYFSASLGCQPCTNPCASCSGPATNECTSCLAGMTLTLGTCTASCDTGKWLDSGTNSCQNCLPNCATCTNSATCQICQSSFFLSGGISCVSNCQSNQYSDVDQVCQNCHSTCLTCSGSGLDQCNTCPVSRTKIGSRCFVTCGSGMFLDQITDTCFICVTNCQTCATSTTCATCKSTHPKNLNTVCSTCYSTEYFDGSGCLPCDGTCSTCSGPGVTGCTACPVGKTLIPTPGPGKCYNTCAANQWLDQPTDTCNPCTANCQVCLDATSCQTCLSGFTKTHLNKCLNCLPTQYDDGIQCLNCASPCYSCQGAANTCLSCISGYDFVPELSKCYRQCPKGNFVNNATNLCENCISTCSECAINTGLTSCSSCANLHQWAALESATTPCVPYPTSCAASEYRNSLGQCTTAAATTPPLTNLVYSRVFGIPLDPIRTGWYYTSASSGTFSKCDCPRCDPITGICSLCPTDHIYLGVAGVCHLRSPTINFQSGTSSNTGITTIASCLVQKDTTCINCGFGEYFIGGACKKACLTTHVLTSGTCTMNNEYCRKRDPLGACTSCDEGTYLSSGVCTKCHPACSICTGALNSQCSKCAAGYHFINPTTCGLTPCIPLTVFDYTNSTCQPLTAGCVLKSSPSTPCTHCDTGYFLLESTGTCHKVCPIGEYFSAADSACKPCHSSCATCITELDTGCISCRLGFTLAASPGACTQETATIASCKLQTTSLGFTKCIAPNPGFALDLSDEPTVYTGACPRGSYLESATAVTCAPCPTGCSDCHGPAFTQCSRCSSGYIRHGSSCIPSAQIPTCSLWKGKTWDSATSTCVDCSVANCQVCLNSTTCKRCKPGFYATGSTCSACATNSLYCHQVTGQILACKTGYMLIAGNLCIRLCEPTMLQMPDGTCNPCTAECLKCIGTGNNCRSCRPGDIRMDYGTRQGCSLAKNVSRNAYIDISGVKTPCTTPCLTCSVSLTSCLTCMPGYYLSSVATCSRCDPRCSECGSTATTCLGCHMGYNLDAGKCIPVCEKYEYLDPVSLDCLPCNPNCQTCDSTIIPGDKCLTCYDGFYLSNGICLPCHESCSKCTGPADTECTTCSSELALIGSKCDLSCPSGSFVRSTSSGLRCYACHKSCGECLGPSAFNCTVCLPTHDFVQNTFTTENTGTTGTCKLKYASSDMVYLGVVPNNWYPCHKDCATCSGLSEHECLTCNTGYFQRGSRCYRCHPFCSTCDGPSPNNCLTCQTGYTINQTEKYCYQDCASPSFFVDKLINTCTACHADCATCDGPAITNCTSCPPTKQYLLTNRTCVASCNTQYYLNFTLMDCIRCHSTCLECNDSGPNNCTSCPAGQHLQVDSSCNVGCADYSYELNTTHCAPCGTGCLTCSGPTINECLTCAPSLFMLANTSCNQACPDNYFGNISSMHCDSCHTSCTTCKNNSRDACLSCPSTRNLIVEGFCARNCAAGQYYFIPDDSCYGCHPSCQNCNGGSMFECSTCQTGRLRNHLGDCVTECPPQTYLNTTARTCNKCHVSCDKCSGPSFRECTGCPVGSVLLKSGVCALQCDPHQFPDSDSVCQECHDTCLSCSGAANNNCTACFKDPVLFLTEQLKCVNCLTNAQSDPKSCWFNVLPIMIKSSQKGINFKASATIRVTFPGETQFTERITPDMLKKTLGISVRGYDEKLYTYIIDKRLGEILIDFYFLNTAKDPVTVMLRPKENVVLTNPRSGAAELIFSNGTSTYEMTAIKAPDSQMVASLASSVNSAESVGSTMAIVGSSLGVIAVVSSTGLGAPLMKFIRVFKMVSRLRLINIFFGAYLELFLAVCGNLYRLGGDPIDLQAIQASPNSRGKLDMYKITVLSSSAVAAQYAVYYVVFIARIYRGLLIRYVKKKAEFGRFDFILEMLAEKGRILLLTMVGIDIFFYSLRCVSHMARPNQFSSVDSAYSLGLSLVTLGVLFADMLLMLLDNSKTNFSNLREAFRKERVDLKKIEETSKSADKPAQPVSIEDNKPSLAAEKTDAAIGRLIITTKGKVLNNKRKNVISRLKGRNPTVENSEKQLRLEATNQTARPHEEGDLPKEEETPEGNDPTKLDSDMKVYFNKGTNATKDDPSSEQFFGNGIKLYKLRTFEGRYYNAISLLKMFAFEPFYVTLQMLPTFQITSMFLLQLVFTVWTADVGIRKKIFTSVVAFISNLANELAILIFLLVGVLFQTTGGQASFSDSTRDKMQFAAIGCVGLACIIGFVEFIVSVGISIVKTIRARKLNKYRSEKQKLKEEKNLVRVRQAGEGSPSKTRKQQVAAADSPWTDKQGPGQAPYDDPSNSSGLKMLDMSDLPGDDFSPAGDEQQPKGMLPQDQTTNNKGLRRRRLVTGAARTKK